MDWDSYYRFLFLVKLFLMDVMVKMKFKIFKNVSNVAHSINFWHISGFRTKFIYFYDSKPNSKN